MFDEHPPEKRQPKASAIWIKPSHYAVVVPLTGGRSLAYSTVRQTLALWDSSETETWLNLCQEGEVALSETYRDFARGGFVVNAAAQELTHLQRAFDKARNDPAQLMITVAPTLACNFKCSYCFQGLEKPLSRMSGKTQDAVLRHITESLPGRKRLHMTWYGGEPLMNAEAVWQMSSALQEACASQGVAYGATMISNGYLMTPAVARKMRKARISKVQITLDGAEETHDSRRHLSSERPTFARIVDNIEAAAAERLLDVSIRVNIDGENERDAMALLEVLARRRLGIRNGVSVYFAPVESVAEAAGECTSCLSKTAYADVENRLHAAAFELGLMGIPKPPKFMGLCTAMRPDSFVVVPNGDLHKCWDTVMDPERRVGSVFGKARASDEQQAERWSGFSPFDNAVCRGCKLLPSCAGACAFKFVHNDYASGETGRLPCPSLKFNLAEQIFARAKARSFVSDTDWDPDRSPTVQPEGPRTGHQHTLATMSTIHDGLTTAERDDVRMSPAQFHPSPPAT